VLFGSRDGSTRAEAGDLLRCEPNLSENLVVVLADLRGAFRGYFRHVVHRYRAADRPIELPARALERHDDAARPELRIVDDELWSAVKARQAATRKLTCGDPEKFKRARRPKFIFSGLARCTECGGGYVMYWQKRLACFNARSRGTCTNRRTISRTELESRVLLAVRDKLMRRDLFAEFCQEYVKELNRLRMEHRAKVSQGRHELAVVEKEIRKRYVPDYFVRLTVTIKPQDRLYFVDGEVKAPGRQIYIGPTTVLKAIASCGGFTDYAKKTKVKLIHADDRIQIINCVKALVEPRLDVEVFPGDKINVPRRYF